MHRFGETLMVALALVFLLAWSIPIINPELPENVRSFCEVLVWATWALFALDVAVRFTRAQSKWVFLRANWLDVAAAVLPLLRPLRLIRVVALINWLNKRASRSLQGRVGTFLFISTMLLIYVAAVAELEAERGAPEANITSFGTALWWAVVTITTVGYGDAFPVTGNGRLIAFGLMLAGVAVIGTVAAMMAGWLISRVERAADSTESEILAELRSLRALVIEAGLVPPTTAAAASSTTTSNGAAASAGEPATAPRVEPGRPE